MPAGAVMRLGRPRLQAGEQAMALAFGPDQTLIAGGAMPELQLWDLKSATVRAKVDLHTKVASPVRVIADGRHIIVGTYEGPIVYLDATTGALRRRIELSVPETRTVQHLLTASPDGTVLVTADPGQLVLYVWDAPSATLKYKLFVIPRTVKDESEEAGPAPPEGHAELPGIIGLSGVAFSRDGRRLAGGASGAFYVWDAATGDEIRRGFAKGIIRSVALSPDGGRIATVATDVNVWDVGSGARLFRQACPKYGLTCTYESAAWADDGRLLVVGEQGRILFLDTDTWSACERDSGSDAFGLAISPDNRTVASAGREGAIALWDAIDGREIRPASHVGAASGVAYGPRGDIIVTSGYDETIRTWDARTGKLKSTLTAPPALLAENKLSPRGDRLLVAALGGGLTVIDLGSGRVLYRLHDVALHTRAASFLDEHTIRVPATDGSFHDLDVTAPPPAPIADRGEYSADASPDGACVAFLLRRTGLVTLMDTATGRELSRMTLPLSLPLPGSLVVTPDAHGRQLVTWMEGTKVDGSFGMRVRLFDVATASELWHHDGDAMAFTCRRVALSPDGAYVAAVAQEQLHLWSAETGKDVGAPRLYSYGLVDLAFSPDGTRVATSCGDGTVLIWPLASQ